MDAERKILTERINERLAALDLSARTVSMKATGKPDVIRDMLRRRSSPSGPTLSRIADILGTTTDYLLGRAATPEQPVSEVGFRDMPTGFRGADAGGIPLLGTGYCDDLAVESDEGMMQVERVQLELDHVVRLIERPRALWNVRDAYAIYFHGSSMEPRYYQGEVGVVDPRRPPSPGDFVVVQMTDGTGPDIVTVLVKQLVRVTSTVVELKQFNPDTTFRIPRKQVARMHRILGSAELYGG